MCSYHSPAADPHHMIKVKIKEKKITKDIVENTYLKWTELNVQNNMFCIYEIVCTCD